MEKKKIQKVSDPVIRLKGVRSMGVIGDPGCEGLGTYNMKVYAGALEECGRDDITLVVGDLVPAGTRHHYQTIQELTEILAGNKVYALRGNHDTGAYTEYFGEKNYAILTESFAVVVLDNAQRTFEEEGIRLLSRVLAMEDVKQAIIAFHIPVPNHFILNCVTEEEFACLKKAYEPWKEKVKYLLCGHVHSGFEDCVDGIPLICTGGGGAMIEDVSKDIRASDVEHHVVHFYERDGSLCHQIVNLSEDCYGRERADGVLRQKLEETVEGELMAHFKYMTFADRAERRGMKRIANLFRALAASEYYHARNFYSILDQPAPFLETVEIYIPGEEFEQEYFYRMLVDYAKEHAFPLAEQAYAGAAAAEKEHTVLLKEAADMEGFSRDVIYVCPVCGYVMTGDKAPERCPVCGGPKKQYEAYVKE
ncbi:rubredoxin-like domain-containing protein [Candidatus Merdisoma sp. JLR.KK006]|uniref:rubredoxin-like domain-containing protein n=1 Tax=Candidatus Merdisoma sp. JLR.KK006 TaxID=3112626 RepID=UPI002FF43874